MLKLLDWVNGVIHFMTGNFITAEGWRAARNNEKRPSTILNDSQRRKIKISQNLQNCNVVASNTDQSTTTKLKDPKLAKLLEKKIAFSRWSDGHIGFFQFSGRPGFRIFFKIGLICVRTSHSFKENQPMHRRRNFLKENFNENSWKLLKWLLVYLYTLNRPLFCF